MQRGGCDKDPGGQRASLGSESATPPSAVAAGSRVGDVADLVCGDLRATRRRCRASLGRLIPAGEELTVARRDGAAWVELGA